MLELDCAHELARPELEPIRRLCWIVLDEDVLDAHALRRRRNFTQTVWLRRGLVGSTLARRAVFGVPDDTLRAGDDPNDLRV